MSRRTNYQIYLDERKADEERERRCAIKALKGDLPSDLLNEELFKFIGMNTSWLEELKAMGYVVIDGKVCKYS